MGAMVGLKVRLSVSCRSASFQCPTLQTLKNNRNPLTMQLDIDSGILFFTTIESDVHPVACCA